MKGLDKKMLLEKDAGAKEWLLGMVNKTKAKAAKASSVVKAIHEKPINVTHDLSPEAKKWLVENVVEGVKPRIGPWHLLGASTIAGLGMAGGQWLADVGKEVGGDLMAPSPHPQQEEPQAQEEDPQALARHIQMQTMGKMANVDEEMLKEAFVRGLWGGTKRVFRSRGIAKRTGDPSRKIGFKEGIKQERMALDASKKSRDLQQAVQQREAAKSLGKQGPVRTKRVKTKQVGQKRGIRNVHKEAPIVTGPQTKVKQKGIRNVHKSAPMPVPKPAPQVQPTKFNKVMNRGKQIWGNMSNTQKNVVKGVGAATVTGGAFATGRATAAPQQQPNAAYQRGYQRGY